MQIIRLPKINRDLEMQEIEIISLLIEKGALLGVKGGATKIHFDNEAVFQGIQYDYWPYRRRN
mgnify:FL=1